MNRDLTVGKPSTVLWKFCLPLFGSIIFQQLYNIADSLVAGKFISENALAAVGNGYEVTLLFIAVAFGCNIGCSVVTAQQYGARQYSQAKTVVYTALIASGVVCLVLMLVGFTALDGLLNLIRTPKENGVFEDSRTYLKVYILSLPFVFYYNVATGVFSALGDSKTPFIFLAASSLANIGADILFVKFIYKGVAAVAWATLICQGISCVLAVWAVLARLRKIPSDGKAAVFSWPILKRISIVAIPSMLQQSFISVGNIVLQGIINSFGPGVMAGYSGAIKLNNLVITGFTTLGNGMSNYAAQNLGAGKPERIREGFRAGLKLVWLLCVPLVLLYLLIGDKLMLLFIDDPSGEAMSVGVQFLRIVSPFYFIASTKQVADGILRGTGLMKRFMSSTFTDLVLRVALAFILSATALRSTGIWLAWPIGWAVGTALSLFFYKTGPWAKQKSA